MARIRAFYSGKTGRHPAKAGPIRVRPAVDGSAATST
jgi:hypothetical protein